MLGRTLDGIFFFRNGEEGYVSETFWDMRIVWWKKRFLMFPAWDRGVQSAIGGSAPFALQYLSVDRSPERIITLSYIPLSLIVITTALI